jgi:hypothetical protein
LCIQIENQNKGGGRERMGEMGGVFGFQFILETGMERDEDGVVLGSTRLSGS